MKRETARFPLLVVTIILATQLSTLLPVTQAIQENGNGNRKRTYAMRVDPEPAQPGARGRRRRRGASVPRGSCRRKCWAAYQRCLVTNPNRPGAVRRSTNRCYALYRRCLSNCP